MDAALFDACTSAPLLLTLSLEKYLEILSTLSCVDLLDVSTQFENFSLVKGKRKDLARYLAGKLLLCATLASDPQQDGEHRYRTTLQHFSNTFDSSFVCVSENGISTSWNTLLSIFPLFSYDYDTLTGLLIINRLHILPSLLEGLREFYDKLFDEHPVPSPPLMRESPSEAESSRTPAKDNGHTSKKTKVDSSKSTRSQQKPGPGKK
ncbi:hypothetical protein VKT23_009861 [Stygiomarasmius scandens]|uniref:Uncharacterized protein n=1 Tax=Marasmiellus scandens TaxID=2682957 RepID=A0ABR1JGV5_9AGAR